jgi:hypothetical protein
MMRSFLAISALCALSLSPQAALAASCGARSPAHTVALVELYTSEGCSSCPPADRWLGSLLSRYSPNQVLPLALHVDYWDYIGWQDPYAQAQFAERQRWLGRLSQSSSIYTPGVFAGMRELRDWRNAASLERRILDINRRPARAGIALELRRTGPRRVEVEARFSLEKSAVAARHLQAVLVLFEDGLVSDVPRGENRGSALHHDRVVRYWSPGNLDGNAERQAITRSVDLPPEWNAAQLASAAFVQDADSGEILQAVATPGCRQAQDQESTRPRRPS